MKSPQRQTMKRQATKQQHPEAEPQQPSIVPKWRGSRGLAVLKTPTTMAGRMTRTRAGMFAMFITFTPDSHCRFSSLRGFDLGEGCGSRASSVQRLQDPRDLDRPGDTIQGRDPMQNLAHLLACALRGGQIPKDQDVRDLQLADPGEPQLASGTARRGRV